MRIKEFKIYSANIKSQKSFFVDLLGFELVYENQVLFTVKIGWSLMTFIQSDNELEYHYCFLIPSNKLNEALNWIEKRTNIIEIKPNKKIQYFESWNAYSFYFYDADGNIAEFIIRNDLKNDSTKIFSINDVYCINEIGVPTIDIKRTNDTLTRNLNTSFWKGNMTSFGTNGGQDGLFLLPNYENRENWFPTDIKIKPAPFEAVIENDNLLFNVIYQNGNLDIQKL